jgi:putative transposase
MRLVEQHRIDRHDPRWPAIDAAAFAAKNRSNAALYVTRQACIHAGRVAPDADLARDLKASAEYRALPATVAQWGLRQVPLAWKSDFAACTAWEADPSRFRGHPKLPKYLDKQGRNWLTDTEQAISRAPKNRGYGVPAGLDIRVDTRQTGIDQVRSVPQATHSTVAVIYERPVTSADGDPARVAAIDIGVNTRAAVTAHQPGTTPLLTTPLLVQGRPVKAINQGYNQRRARLHAKLSDGVVVSRQLDLLTDQRQRQITSSLHTSMSPVAASWTGWCGSASARW